MDLSTILGIAAVVIGILSFFSPKNKKKEEEREQKKWEKRQAAEATVRSAPPDYSRKNKPSASRTASPKPTSYERKSSPQAASYQAAAVTGGNRQPTPSSNRKFMMESIPSQDLKQAIVWSEILGKPVSRKRHDKRRTYR